MAESRDKLFENWIKSGLALKYTESVLLPFVEEVLAHHHETIYKTVLTNSIDNTKCNDCLIQNVVECYTPKICSGSAKKCTFHDMNDHTKTYRQCPKNHCNRVKDEIVASHRHKAPSFKNTRSEKWCVSSWEVAKCFISTPWYNDKKSVREVDLTGLINLLLNNREFQLKISANLGDETNPFSKARDVRNEIMHEPNLEIPEQKLKEYISILSDVLSDPKHIGVQPQARLVIQKLNELPSMEVTVENKEKIRTAIHDAKDHALSELVEERENSLQLIKEETQIGVQKIQEVTQSSLKRILDKVSKQESIADETKTKIIRPYEPEEETTFDKDVKRLRQHLIDLYMNTGLCKIVVPPCIHDEEVDIEDIYIEPRYTEATYNNLHSICTFLKPNSLLFLSARPGTGKSTLCRKITSSWCKVHTGNNRYYSVNQTMDLLKSYDLLFNIPSDKIPSTSESLEELIKNAILPLEFHSAFDEVIKTKTCLIIIDGLEEGYVTEEGTTMPIFDSLPNVRCFENNTLLVTSRQNKLETLSNFKRIVPFKGNAYFRSVYEQVYEKIHTFLNTVQERKIHRWGLSLDIDFTPTDDEPSFFLASCIAAMMYEGTMTTISSALQIYCNVLDFILEYAQFHVGDTTETNSTMVTKDKTQADNFVLPKCLHELQYCQRYKNLVHSVSKLAFNIMFKSVGHNVTMFSASVATQSGLSCEEMKLCISAGVLIRCKINRSKNSPAFTDILSFPDESFQGFLAGLCLHISTDDALNYRVIQSLTSLDMIYEKTNVIGLLCELKPSLLPEIGRHVAALSDVDERVIWYRQNYFLTNMYFNDFNMHIVQKIQQLAFNCILMSLHEDHEYTIQINDLNTNELKQFLDLRNTRFAFKENKERISFNQILTRIECSRMKTFDMQGSMFDHTIDFQSLWISERNSLEAIRIEGDSVADVSGVISNASSTLKHLVMCSVCLKDNSYNKAIDDASHLTFIVLQNISISHIDKTKLLVILSTKTELEHLTLEISKCLACVGNKSCGEDGLLDISRHSHLRSIALTCNFFNVEFSQHLTNLDTVHLFSVKANVIESVGKRLQTSTSIRVFSCQHSQCVDSIPDMSFIRTLISLTTIRLSHIKFDQNIFQLSSDMVCLKKVDLINIIMTLSCLEKFISSLPTSNKGLAITMSFLQVMSDRPTRFVLKYLKEVKQFNVSITEYGDAINVRLIALSLDS